MNIRETVTNVLSCVQCIAIMVLLGVGLDEKKTPCAAVLFHDLSSPVSLNAYNTSAPCPSVPVARRRSTSLRR